jgi:hypothetical protein
MPLSLSRCSLLSVNTLDIVALFMWDKWGTHRWSAMDQRKQLKLQCDGYMHRREKVSSRIAPLQRRPRARGFFFMFN